MLTLASRSRHVTGSSNMTAMPTFNGMMSKIQAR
jgi:hypothetical protein